MAWIEGQEWYPEAIIYALRRDFERRKARAPHSEIELFEEALALEDYPASPEVRQVRAEADYHAVMGGADPPMYIKHMISALVATSA